MFLINVLLYPVPTLTPELYPTYSTLPYPTSLLHLNMPHPMSLPYATTLVLQMCCGISMSSIRSTLPLYGKLKVSDPPEDLCHIYQPCANPLSVAHCQPSINILTLY